MSVDGTKVDANANKYKNIRYDRSHALREQLRAEIEELLERAESEDAQEEADPQALPEELARRARTAAEAGRADWIAAMRAKMALPEERARYRLRRQKVEPVFGIVKQAMGFRQFLLRGLDKVESEWVLVMLAYNCKRLHNLTLA